MMNCNNILEKYLTAVNENSIVKNIGEHCVLITPYLHSNGVYLSIYASPDGDLIKLHDNSETLQSLASRGVKIFDSPNKKDLLNHICIAYGVSYEDWTIYKSVKVEKVGEAVIDLINALKSINDMIFLHQVSSSDNFKFEVKAYFKDKNLSVTQDYKIQGKSTLHRIDFHSSNKNGDNLINIISGKSIHEKVVRTGFNYYDIHATGKQFKWLSVVNPEDKWTKTSYGILGTFSTIISWEHKNQLLDFLN